MEAIVTDFASKNFIHGYWALALDIAELRGAKAEALDSIISDNLCFST